MSIAILDLNLVFSVWILGVAEVRFLFGMFATHKPSKQKTDFYFMKLSTEAIKDLRVALRKSYGESFDAAFTDEEVNEIGDLLLNVLAESLKLKNSFS